MKQQILNLYAETLATAEKLVGDIPDDRFVELPHEGSKNPAWILGHLCVASGMGADILAGNPGGLAGVPDTWAAACMPDTAPQGERGLYGSKDELLDHLRRLHGLLAERFTAASAEDLAAVFPIEEYREFFPTNGDAVVYLMAFHEGWHLGQLSEWRRAAGLGAPPA
jgi:hypothetical protein